MFCFCGPTSLGFLASDRLQGQKCVRFLWYYDTGYPRFSSTSHWKTATHVCTHNKHPNMRHFLEFFFSLLHLILSDPVSLLWSARFTPKSQQVSPTYVALPLRCLIQLFSPLAHLPQSAHVDTTEIFMWINPQPSFLYSGKNA